MLHAGFPEALRRWRLARRLSQQSLADEAEISARHLSCLETGKAQPSREMVLLLANALDLGLRERNELLTFAGYAAVYRADSLDSLALEPVRRAIDLILTQQEPFGAVVFDRSWDVLRMNAGATRLLGTFADAEADPRALTNLVRAILHPRVLRPAMTNWRDVAAMTLARLVRECALFPTDTERRALLDEVVRYPDVGALPTGLPELDAPAITVDLARGEHRVRLFTMLTSLGTPLDVTAQELTIESYFPADGPTERWFRDRA